MALELDPGRCALIIQDMQNASLTEGGAFSTPESRAHHAEQNLEENINRIADRCRELDIPVFHVWFIVEPGSPGFKVNAGLFEAVASSGSLDRGTWGAEPSAANAPVEGDFIIEKMRMSAFHDTRLDTMLKGFGRDTLILTGVLTNMAMSHTARTGADLGYYVVFPENASGSFDGEWHRVAVDYALQNVSTVTDTDSVLAALA